jgi:hypothetical protein
MTREPLQVMTAMWEARGVEIDRLRAENEWLTAKIKRYEDGDELCGACRPASCPAQP